MRLTGVSTPIVTFAIPPSAPEPVQHAWLELNRVGALLEDAKSDLKDAKAALVQAQAADVRAAVAATGEGREVTDPQERERVAQAEVHRLEALLPGYRQAADEAGNTLAQVIADHKDEWAESLTERADELAAAYDEALAEARLALAAFIPAQAGRNWVANFDASQARSGQYTQFSGGRVRVSGRRVGIQELRAQYDPVDLLQVAALATASPPPRTPEPPSRRTKVAA
jgi:hypothetical protein